MKFFLVLLCLFSFCWSQGTYVQKEFEIYAIEKTYVSEPIPEQPEPLNVIANPYNPVINQNEVTREQESHFIVSNWNQASRPTSSWQADWPFPAELFPWMHNWAFVRFNLSSMAGFNVTSATISLRQSGGHSCCYGGKVELKNFDAWNSNTLSWDEFSTTVKTAADAAPQLAELAYDAWFSKEIYVSVEPPLTNEIKQAFDSNQQLGIAIYPIGADENVYSSWSDAKIIVNYSEFIPAEPASTS